MICDTKLPTVLQLTSYQVDDVLNNKADTWTKWEPNVGSPVQHDAIESGA